MKPEEIRKLSPEEIEAKLMDAREDLMRLRFRHATGELTDHSRIRTARQLIARYLTVLKEYEQEQVVEGEE